MACWKESWGSTGAWRRPGDADISHEVRHGAVRHHQRVECIIMVCVTWSIPLFSTLSWRPSPSFAGYRRSYASSCTTLKTRNHWRRTNEFFERPSFSFLSVSLHHKTAIWWNPDVGDRWTVERQAFDVLVITIKTYFSKISKTSLRVCVRHTSPNAFMTPSSASILRIYTDRHWSVFEKLWELFDFTAEASSVMDIF